MMNITNERYFASQDPDALIGKFIAILGVPGSGKSNTAAVLMEESLNGGIPICVIDIAGEYFKLKEKYPDITIVGRSINCIVDVSITMENVAHVAKIAYENGKSVVLDLSAYDTTVRPELLFYYFSAIYSRAAALKIPLLIFAEEAHNWVPQRGTTQTSLLFTDIAAEGRKRGLSFVLIAQRSARVNKDVLAVADLYFLHKVVHPTDMKVYVDLLPWKRSVTIQKIMKLKTGSAYILKGDRALLGTIRLRTTESYGKTPTRDDIPVVQETLFGLLNKKNES